MAGQWFCILLHLGTLPSTALTWHRDAHGQSPDSVGKQSCKKMGNIGKHSQESVVGSLGSFSILVVLMLVALGYQLSKWPMGKTTLCATLSFCWEDLVEPFVFGHEIC